MEREEKKKQLKDQRDGSAAADLDLSDILKAEEDETALRLAVQGEESIKGAISTHEIKCRLREYGQPITLFGEDDEQRLNRLKQYEVEMHDRLQGASEGRRAEFQKLLSNEVENEILQAQVSALDNEKSEVDEVAVAKAQKKAAKRQSKYEAEKKKEDFESKEDYILHWFKRVLVEWEKELAARPDAIKRSTKGKVASATQKQTRQYIRPLFKLLKTRTVSSDILSGVEKVVDHCLAREYQQATKAYLTLAIGNAPWPMGVTMVGIHERAGREKIFSHQVAHVLNDEVQRKYIQSIKRLMSFAQHKYPNIPSKNAG
jgi:pre-mRNA-splicing factor 18